MGSWFCIWDDLLCQFAIARVVHQNNRLNLVPNPMKYRNIGSKLKTCNEKQTKNEQRKLYIYFINRCNITF